MDRGAWQAAVHAVAESDTTDRLHFKEEIHKKQVFVLFFKYIEDNYITIL